VSPFEVLTRPLTLKPRKRAPSDLGPTVAVQASRLLPAGDDKALKVLCDKAGLRDADKDGLLEQDTNAGNMWVSKNSSDTALEFELEEQVPLSGIEVWNFNLPFQTDKGLRQADVAVSEDGTSWKTVLRGVSFKEAEGTSDYDEPTVLKLDNVKAKKVRLEKLVSLSSSGEVGLSKIMFHKSTGAQ
jgi:hypothetical protein